ncbi:MAG: hypothetical protein SH857_13585 [Chitinophagales bacterium]|nr:hypothetical protein [Chitinophagales bacterium]
MPKSSSFLLLVLCLCFGYQSANAGGPWTPQKHKGIFIASVSPNIYKNISGDSGGLALQRRVSDITTQFYVEYGITNKLALTANFPLKYVQTGRSIEGSDDFNDTLPAGRMAGYGNPEAELKYQFVNKKIILAGACKVEAPVTQYNNSNALRTGYDTWSFIPTVYMGHSFSSRLYIQGMAAFAFRINDYSDEWRAAVEVGYKLKRPFWIALFLQARQSINNGSRNDADLLTSNNLHTGLYMNDQQYFAWEFKFSYAFNPRLGINWALAGGLTTRYIARTPAFSFGVYYNWAEKKG